MSWGKKKWRNRDPLCICFTVGEKRKKMEKRKEKKMKWKGEDDKLWQIVTSYQFAVLISDTTSKQ